MWCINLLGIDLECDLPTPPRFSDRRNKKRAASKGQGWRLNKSVYRYGRTVGHLTVGEFTGTGVPLFLFAFLVSS